MSRKLNFFGAQPRLAEHFKAKPEASSDCAEVPKHLPELLLSTGLTPFSIYALPTFSVYLPNKVGAKPIRQCKELWS